MVAPKSVSKLKVGQVVKHPIALQVKLIELKATVGVMELWLIEKQGKTSLQWFRVNGNYEVVE